MIKSIDKKIIYSAIPLFIIILFAIWGLFFVDDPMKLSFHERNLPPSLQHIFGTDDIGCDLFNKTCYAINITIFISFVSVIISALAGILLGFLSGFFHESLIDKFLINLCNILLSFPNFFLIIVLVAILGTNVSNLIVVIAISYFPTVYRMIRSEVLNIKQTDFIQISLAMGGNWLHIFKEHIFPNLRNTLLAVLLAGTANAIITESALSFLGLGVPLDNPSLGSLLASGRNYLRAWWLSFFPGLIIFMLNYSLRSLGKIAEKTK